MKFSKKIQRPRLIKYLNSLGLIGWNPKKIYGWIVPTNMYPQLCTDRVLWIGDSARMASESGHGMPNMFIASKPLAETCVKALKTNDFSRKNLESYQNSKEMQTMLKRSEEYNKIINTLNFFNKFAPRFIKRWFIIVKSKQLNHL